MENVGAVLHGPMDLRMEKIKQPIIAENDVLLSMGSVGLCGSDLKYWKSGKCGRFELRQPMVMGHEASGTVMSVGAKVTSLQPGDRVAIEPGVPCRKCKLCRHGRYNLCPDVRFCATPPVDGNLCRFFSHPADFCFKLPEEVSLDEGAMMEPLAVAIYTCRRADVTSGSNILICGAGPVGLLCMMVAKSTGASSVVITDIDDHRLSMAKSLGADHVIKVKTRDPEELANQVQDVLGCKPDATLECSGTDFSMAAGIHATESGGSVVLVGRGSPTPQLPITLAATREVDIKGIFRYANCYPTALSILQSRAFDVTPLITHHFSLHETLRAFETAVTPETRAVKVMIHCDQ
ncbi:sorbitol dehydrogenase-like isoform X2 [Babylonia areolata]|uniref:sorbitol dehydrogenase-like isoform X2 n=1 Tax=Babylonia areolata TaxID=304850 RepID=UPI003FD24431